MITKKKFIVILNIVLIFQFSNCTSIFAQNNVAVDYSRLTPVLIEAIKEQQEIIENLKASNQSSELKIKNSELKINNSELKIQKLEAAVQTLMEAAIKEEAKK